MRPCAQDTPTAFRDFNRWLCVMLVTVHGSKALGRGAKNLLEFPAEMRLISKFQLIRSRFIRIPLRNKLLCQPALQIPQPMTGRAPQMLAKQPLQLSLRDRAKRGHFCGIEIGLPRYLLPLLDCQ